ncbi:hypothetical protein EDD11_007970 [Mortierella claussenii]|nr:hypothetical protein EDD11_007970 [Mortierella claussenii]
MTSPTSRAISRLGIGTYRMALGIPEHERVLYRALERQKDPRHNITLIDTSTNYANGRSEQLIGKVLSHPRLDTLTREEVVIATKFGYIQNDNMRLLLEGVFKRVPPEEIVEYSTECYHCIHPEFMRDQLTRSLERLRTKYVDVLFVHNPEYYLMSNVKDLETDVKRHQNILLDRLAVLFEDLEREIERGRIRAYGVSSNSFSLKPSHAHFLPYQDLVQMASQAFERVKAQKQEEGTHALWQPGVVEGSSGSTPQSSPLSSSQAATLVPKSGSAAHLYHASAAPKVSERTSHGLSYLQMPGNLLEMEGIKTTSKWAKSQGLQVFVNRPLNAMSTGHHPVRLASYPSPMSPTYEEAKASVLDALTTFSQHREYLQLKMQRLRDMIKELDASLKIDNISIIHVEGASIRNRLHNELAMPIKICRPHVAQEHSGHAEGAALDRRNQHSSEHSHRLQQYPPAPAHPQPQSDKKQILIKPSSQEIDDLLKHLDSFVDVFHQQVRSRETERVTEMLAERGIDLKGEPIEQFAVEHLLEHAQVDSILLGMKREHYVEFARNILRTLTD